MSVPTLQGSRWKCVHCGEPIPEGTYLDELEWDEDKHRWSHKIEGVDHTPPGSSQREEAKAVVPGPERQSTSPAPLPGEPTIYTYHRRLNIWSQGVLVGFIEDGVSTKGRNILPIEAEAVDERIRFRSQFNERGEVHK